MCKQQTQSILILLRILILVTLFPHTHCESSSDTPTDSCSSSSHSNTCTNDMSATVSYIRRRIQRGEESIRRMINSYTACRSTHVILNHSTFHSTFKRYSTFTLLSSSAVAISSQPSPSSAPAASFVSRRPSLQVLSVEQSEGVGARVRRSIGRPELRNFDPFLMLDHFKATNKGGFPDHP